LGSPEQGTFSTNNLNEASRRYVTSGNQVTGLPGPLFPDLELVIPKITLLGNANKENILNYHYYIRIGKIKKM